MTNLEEYTVISSSVNSRGLPALLRLADRAQEEQKRLDCGQVLTTSLRVYMYIV